MGRKMDTSRLAGSVWTSIGASLSRDVKERWQNWQNWVLVAGGTKTTPKKRELSLGKASQGVRHRGQSRFPRLGWLSDDFGRLRPTVSVTR